MPQEEDCIPLSFPEVLIYWRFVLCLSSPLKSRHAQVCSRSSEAKQVRAQRQHKSATSSDWSRSTSPCCSRATLEGSSCSWSSPEGVVQLLLAWWRPSARRWRSTWVWQKSTQGQEDRSTTRKIKKLVLWKATVTCRGAGLLGYFLKKPWLSSLFMIMGIITWDDILQKMVVKHLAMYSPCQASPCQPYWGQPWRCLVARQSLTLQSSRLQRFPAWSLKDKTGIAVSNDFDIEAHLIPYRLWVLFFSWEGCWCCCRQPPPWRAPACQPGVADFSPGYRNMRSGCAMFSNFKDRLNLGF